MKVVHVCRGFGDYMVGLLDELGRRVETHVVLADKDLWLEKELTQSVHVFHSGAPAVRSPRNVPALRRIARYIADVRPDVVHFQSGLIWELFLMYRFPAVPGVLTVHDVTRHPSRGSMRLFPQSLLDAAGRMANTVIVHGSALVPAAESRYGKPGRVFVVPHGIITRYGTGTASVAPRDGGRVLLFGTIDAWKGVEFLVAAAPLIRSALPGVQIRVAGGCEDPDYYSALVRDEPAVSMSLRRQSESEVRELLEWADLVVLPYVEASQSGVLQLAFAFGVPVVVTDAGALKEAVASDGCGIVIPSRNTEALAGAVVTLLTDLRLRQQVIDNIVRARATRFSWSNIAASTVSIYEQAIAGKAQANPGARKHASS